MKSSITKRYEFYSRIRWVARVLSVVSILILLMFFIGEGIDIARISGREMIGIMFFPIGVAVGFFIAWKWETAGGLVSLFSLFCFYVVYGFILSGNMPRGFWFLIFTFPGFVFVVAGIYGRIAIAGEMAARDQVK